MTKIDTITVEYEHCGECPHTSDWLRSKGPKCSKADRIIPDLWGDIPDWCPLETKEEECQK